MRKPILNTLALFAAMGRPLSLGELRRSVLFADWNKNALHEELSLLKREGLVVSSGAHITVKNAVDILGAAEEKNRLYKRKIGGLKRLLPVFKFTPFVDFVFVSGSLAFGAPHENSDIDVIVGGREGKIFTVRLFMIFFGWLLGARRESGALKEEGSGKICFNHFVAPSGYELKAPKDFYWAVLYRNLIPVYGSKNAVFHFLEANKWAPAMAQTWDYFFEIRKNWFRGVFEAALGGKIGNYFESFARRVQFLKFQRSLRGAREGRRPRVYFGDDELEFHPDTRRIKEYLDKKDKILRELLSA